MTQDFFKKRRFAVICHDFIYGPPHELRDYLLSQKAKEVLFIGHVNRYVGSNTIRKSYCEHWVNGKLVKKYEAIDHHLPEICAYGIDLFYSLFWLFKVATGPVDVCIGSGNINAFAGLLSQWCRRTVRSVYYVIDYAENRFSNRMLNYLYHLLDAICARYVRCTWNYADSMIQKRNRKWHTTFAHQTVVPNGIRLRRDIIIPREHCTIHEILYMGTLTGFQGVDMVIQALPDIRAVYPDTVFTVIGNGKDMSSLKALAKKLKVTDAVTFLGFIDDPREMERRIAHASLGAACYDTHHPLIFTTEPGKVKRYLACGVPVIMTDVSPIADDIRNRCGFIINNDYKDFVKTVVGYFGNEKLMENYRKQAVLYASRFEWKSIFGRAFDKI